MKENGFERYTTKQVTEGLGVGTAVIGKITESLYRGAEPVLLYQAEKVKRKIVVGFADRMRKIGVASRRRQLRLA